MTEKSKETVMDILNRCVDNAISRTHKSQVFRPFHEALLSESLVKASSFERSFSTSFGQGPIEEISSIIAADNGFRIQRQKETMINVFKGAIDEVERISSSLRAGNARPNWTSEVKRVTAFNRGETEVRRIITDLWLQKDKTEIYISIKTVKPNLDQTEIAKKDMLLLKAFNPGFETYLGLYYNPGGPQRSDYNWTMPMKIFDMHRHESVLIGKDYWDKIGGEGSYEQLIEIFELVGRRTRTLLLK